MTANPPQHVRAVAVVAGPRQRNSFKHRGGQRLGNQVRGMGGANTDPKIAIMRSPEFGAKSLATDSVFPNDYGSGPRPSGHVKGPRPLDGQYAIEIRIDIVAVWPSRAACLFL